MTATDALLYAFASLVVGAALSLITSRARRLAGWIAFAATTAAGLLAGYAAAAVLRSGSASSSAPYVVLPALGSSLRLSVDGLSAIFLALIALISILAALYSVRYMDHYPDYGVGRYYPNFLLFVAGMYGIVTTTDLMVFFCLFWQLMTIPSFLLVRFEHRKRESVRAAWRYLLMMEVSCALVMAAAWLLAGTGPERYDFDALVRMVGVTPGMGLALVFALFLVGFGIKAGMWPFGQMWLPDAHPAAPSPVSALLSGVMIKTGVYGLMRTFIWMVPASALDVYPSAAWGLTIALLGTITLFVGTLQALKQEQSKRLLAFHSIGQVGYILLGLGACVALLRPGTSDPAVMTLAAMAFFGALFHTLNHATFKSLLFMNAGSMLSATGTQDLNKMGGLMRYMPVTALTCLVASSSIAGVPGFNGFASKWSLYVAAILGSAAAPYLALCGLVAILTSALTLASFLKFFGMAFLSRSSALVRERAAKGLEVGALMRVPQIVLAALCVLMGVVPAIVLGLMSRALAASAQGLATFLNVPPSLGRLGGIWAADGSAVFSPVVMVVAVALAVGLAKIVAGLGAAERRQAEPWLCGYAPEAESNRYRAHGMYGEFKRYFGWVGGLPRPASRNGDGGAPVGTTGPDALGKV
jgi:formate hydrogenlyase subunit 3/multisubunit Na+/H+ antiporter MnhD subunit